jgi:hypothetical protein
MFPCTYIICREFFMYAKVKINKFNKTLFFNNDVVLEKEGEGQLDRSCEK